MDCLAGRSRGNIWQVSEGRDTGTASKRLGWIHVGMNRRSRKFLVEGNLVEDCTYKRIVRRKDLREETCSARPERTSNFRLLNSG